jgi:hypothetical protein
LATPFFSVKGARRNYATPVQAAAGRMLQRTMLIVLTHRGVFRRLGNVYAAVQDEMLFDVKIDIIG